MEAGRPEASDPAPAPWFSAPQELRELARRMAKLGGWELLVDAGTVYWDEEVAATHGQPSTHRLSVQEALAAYAPESRQRFQVLLDACIRSGAPFDDEFELVTPDGRHVWLRGIGRALRAEDGRITSVHGACQDITERVTERRQAQARADGLGQQLQATLESMSDAFVMLDAEFRVLYINRAAARAAKRDAGELRGLTLWQCFPRTVGTRYEFETRRAMRERVPVVFEECSLQPVERWLEVREFPSAEGGLAVYFRDITKRKLAESERRTAEAKLSQAQKMESLGTLAGGIAHDFNNMLSAILGNTGLALEHVDAAHPVRGHLENIRSASQRARELVRRILAFSRTETALTASRVQSLAPVLEEALAMLRVMLPAGVELRSRLADEPVYVNLDATSMQQVLLNLCTNAWQALHDARGWVEVGMDRVAIPEIGPAPRMAAHLCVGSYAHLWVTDNGSGIEDATRQRLFEPFFTTKPRGQGTGLGLPAVRGIVEAHGGSIVIDSSLGHGASFHVYLPARPPPAEARLTAHALPSHATGGGRCVLLVDDDPIVLLATEHVLLRLGYRVVAHADAQQALQDVAAQRVQADIVVTDFSMPSMSGLDLARELVRLRPELPIVLSSGYISDDVRRLARGAGIKALLHKEDAFEELGHVVAKVLAGDGLPDADPRDMDTRETMSGKS